MKRKGLAAYLSAAAFAAAVLAAVLLWVPEKAGKKAETGTNSETTSSSENISEGPASEASTSKASTSEGPSSEKSTSEEPSSEISSSETETSSETDPSSETPSSEPVSSFDPYAPELPHVAEGPVKDMLRMALTYVSRSMGYSMEDRLGEGGHFDCSGFLSLLLRDALGEYEIGWFGSELWDTAYWRYYCSTFKEGGRVRIGSALYEVRMKESYDFEHAWEVPGAIVIQYPPENDPSVGYGHASIALGRIPYETTADVIAFLKAEYGVDLSGMAGGPNRIPMVYDPYGPGAGHTTWKVNANGVAKATCVDNNYANDPAWIERISAVFVPVYE